MILRKNNMIFKIGNSVLIDLPSPSNINLLWNFGSLLGMLLTSQILTGFFLAMHFCADTDISFECMAHILRDVNYGWLIRTFHANGASLMFIVIFLHIGRGLYFSSYVYFLVWQTGIILLILLMMTAFLGYILPWGQMSLWGATVITNLLSAIPYIGNQLTSWIWGGFSINSATLTRFFTLHYLMPLLMSLLVATHIAMLHMTGSNNPLGTPRNIDKIPFHPFFSWKDLMGTLGLVFLFIFLGLIFPNILCDPENFIKADKMLTPPHIQPEWYFLFAYAILRSVPNKLGGVLGLLSSLLILSLLPIFKLKHFCSLSLQPLSKMFYWCFCSNFMLLTFLGAQPIETPFYNLSQLSSLFYFFWFLV